MPLLLSKLLMVEYYQTKIRKISSKWCSIWKNTFQVLWKINMYHLNTYLKLLRIRTILNIQLKTWWLNQIWTQLIIIWITSMSMPIMMKSRVTLQIAEITTGTKSKKLLAMLTAVMNIQTISNFIMIKWFKSFMA